MLTVAVTAIGSVEDLLRFLSEQVQPALKEQHGHNRAWFSGHSQTGWPLQPRIYRPRFGDLNEQDRLRKEQHLTQDFRVMVASYFSWMRIGSLMAS
jgi:hypothetical protein